MRIQEKAPEEETHLCTNPFHAQKAKEEIHVPAETHVNTRTMTLNIGFIQPGTRRSTASRDLDAVEKFVSLHIDRKRFAQRPLLSSQNRGHSLIPPPPPGINTNLSMLSPQQILWMGDALSHHLLGIHVPERILEH